jgi:hypothetical protein
MKKSRIILLLFAFISLSFYGCKKESTAISNNHLGEPFSIKANENISLTPVKSENSTNDSSLTVGFEKVVYDSRCPKESCYLCYGSSAQIQVLLTFQKKSTSILLSIPGCQDEFNCDDQLYYRKDTLGYRICFLKLYPYPIGSTPINPSDYTAKLNISKL